MTIEFNRRKKIPLHNYTIALTGYGKKDLKREGLSHCDIVTGRKRVRLEELARDKERWMDITAASDGDLCL